jgi:hypothetical protein
LKKLLVFAIFVISVSPRLFGATYRYVGKITKLRGDVTVLSPGQLTSRKLLMGDKVKEDTSIVTGEKSFVRLTMADGSSLNLGPNSKTVVVTMDKKGNGLVTLLKGKMRSVIKRNAKKDKKFYVQTRSAAMAVRGTEFETIYNPENKVSSLLTYKGEVAINKTKDFVEEKSQKEITRNGKKIVLRNRPTKNLSRTESLAKVFKKKGAVVVKGGQFSTTVKKLNVVSQPVKISPVQLNSLYKNPEYIKKSQKDIKPANTSASRKGLTLKSVAQAAPLEGVIDIENKKFAAKSGGFLDFETGLYVAPGSDAKFNEKKKIFEPNGLGQIDVQTGQYAAPKGLKLVPTKGFVLDTENLLASNDNSALVGKEKSLNDALGGKLIFKEDKVVEVTRNLAKEKYYNKSIMKLDVKGFGQTLEYNDDSYLGGSDKINDIDGKSIGLSLRFASKSNMQMFASISRKSINFEPTSSLSFNNDLDDMYDLEAGIFYSLKPRVNLIASFSLDQRAYVNHVASGSNTTNELKKMAIPKLGIGAQGSFAHSRNWSADYFGMLSYLMSRDSGSLETSSGVELHLEIIYKYWFSKKYFLDSSFFINNQKLSLSGTSRTFDSDIVYSTSGLHFSLGIVF